MDKRFKKDGTDRDLYKANYLALQKIKEAQKEHSNRLDKIESDIEAIKEAQANHGDLLKQIVQLLTKGQ